MIKESSYQFNVLCYKTLSCKKKNVGRLKYETLKGSYKVIPIQVQTAK